ncbi:hypothetical protein L218DRAFT_159775 [Marasmius fiardii PR-910]|nr:hypothetical protein L218DRAFT_159775 [Marasmius fiardii PR-910]
MFVRSLVPVLLLAGFHSQLTLAQTLVFDGRISQSTKNETLDASADPWLTAVKGKNAATKYSGFLGPNVPPTPLGSKGGKGNSEQVISIRIDNSSIFVPGGATGTPQNGFRRTELIAQKNQSVEALKNDTQTGITRFHFSIKEDQAAPLNLTHEYQIVFIEPSDGSHVFGVKLGSPFTIPTGTLPAANANFFKVLDHNSTVLFQTPFTSSTWHNFAVQVDWNARTLEVFYSTEGDLLVPVTNVKGNPTATVGAAGQGEFHIGVLKLPLANPADSPADQGNVVRFGLQEGTTEGLLYSGVFVERIS